MQIYTFRLIGEIFICFVVLSPEIDEMNNQIFKKIALIGAGNIAWNLIPSFQQAGLKVVQLISRSADKLERFQAAYQIAEISKEVKNLKPEVDLVFLCLPDRMIMEVVEQLPATNAVVVHTSGSTALEALKVCAPHIGVFYPLQIFTQQKIADMSQIPIFLEGEGEVLVGLDQLARKLSQQVYHLHSEERLRLHLGAVMACNFSNLMFKLAQEVLPIDLELDFSIYEALIREHIDKVLAFQPENTQTGPAIRGDMETIDQHLNLLTDQPAIRKVYWELSRLINPNL